MKNNYDVSLTMPAIRTHNWLDFYNSAKEACRNYTFQVVIVSPFDLPKELKGIDNIKIIKDFGNPSRCTQIANIEADGNLIYNCVDDGVFLPNSIDDAIALYRMVCTDKDVVNVRYKEGGGRSGGTIPLQAYTARFHGDLQLPGVKDGWQIALHFLMTRETYINMGGIDCQFEYSNHGIHDLMFRLQANGGKIFPSRLEGLNCTHYPGHMEDHGPIHDAQTIHDDPIFRSIYINPNAAFDRLHLDIDNWKNCPANWERRFKGIDVTSYKDLL